MLSIWLRPEEKLQKGKHPALNHRGLTLAWGLMLWSVSSWSQPTTNLTNIAPEHGNSALPKVESKLPKCEGQSPRGWNMCFGAFTFPNGNSYLGEWKSSRRDGVGTLRIVSSGPTNPNNIGSKLPSTYVGEFRSGQLHGHGVWVVDNGERYEGEFSMNTLVRQDGVQTPSFGSDADKARKKCETYGLKFGSGDYAQCMLTQERLVNEAALAKSKSIESSRASEDTRKAELQKTYDEQQQRNAEIKARESKCLFVKSQEYLRPVLGGFFQSMQNANNAYDNCMAGVPQIITTCSKDGLGTITCASR